MGKVAPGRVRIGDAKLVRLGKVMAKKQFYRTAIMLMCFPRDR